MKKLMIAIALASATLMSVAEAGATELAFPLWACKLRADVQDHSLAFVVGVVAIEGKGTIKCRSLVGQKSVQKDVVVQILGADFGPHFAIPTGGDAKLTIWSAEVGVSSVEAMSGEFSLDGNLEGQLGDIRATVARDIRVTPAIPNGGISTGYTLSLQKGGTFGLGLAKGIKVMSIMSPAQAEAKQAFYKNLYEQRMNERNSSN